MVNWSNYDTFKSDKEIVMRYYAAVHRCVVLALCLLLKRKVPRALDIACGHGDSTKVLTGFAESIVGVDSSEGLIALAREREFDADVQFVCSTFERFEHTGSGFDLISGSWFLNHVHSENELAATAQRIQAMLNPGGSVLFVVPSDAFTSNRTQKLARVIDWVQAWTNEDVAWTEGIFRFGDEWIPTTVWQPLFLMQQLRPYFDLETWDIKGTLVRENLLPELHSEPPFEVIYGRLKEDS